MKNYISFALLLELIKHKRVKASYLAQKFELSTRTIYRYLNELESAGIRTFSKQGRNGGIGLEENLILNTILLSDNEKQYLKKQLLYIIQLKKEPCDEQLCNIIINKLGL